MISVLGINKGLGKFIKDHLPKLVNSIKHAADELPEGSGAEKLEVAAKFAAGLFDIPLLPEFVEVMLVKAVLTTIVELAKAASEDDDWLGWLIEHFDL